MSFIGTNNKIDITNTNNQLIFSTDWKMPAIISIVQGSITLPNRGNSAGNTIFIDHNLGSINPASNFVLSTIEITGTTSSYPWKNSKFNSTGTVISNLSWNLVNNAWRLSGCRSLTFQNKNGNLVLTEEYYNTNPRLQLSSVTLTYKVYTGRFT